MPNPPDQEANIPDTFTPDEVADALKIHFGEDCDINSLVIKSAFNSDRFEVSEIWSQAGVLYLSVKADAPPPR